jgi:lipoprotein-anchoring transpeptidase ErfK/SrfK
MDSRTVLPIGSNIPVLAVQLPNAQWVDYRAAGLTMGQSFRAMEQGLHMGFAGLAGMIHAAQTDASHDQRGSSATFSRRDQQIVVARPDGVTLVYPAANNTVNPSGNPNRVSSNGPAPNGTFPVQRAVPTGNSPSYGPYFYPIGAVGPNGEPRDIARQRGIGLHGGRTGYSYPTHGCIRMNNGDIINLHNQTQNAPLQAITIGD